MEHLGWNSIIPSRSSAWSSQQQEELQQAAAKGFNSTMWMNITDSGFPTLDDISNTTANSNNEVDYSSSEKLNHITPASDPAGLNIVSLNQLHQENEVSIFGNAFSQQQQQNLSSSAGSSQLSDYILSSNTPLINAYSVEDHFVEDHFEANAKLLGAEGDGISSSDNITTMPSSSAVWSKKRKAAAEDAHIGKYTPVEMIKFNDIRKKRRINDRKELNFGSTSLENNEYVSSSSAEGGSGGFKLITSKKASTPPAASKKSSNISFQLNATSSDNDSQPDSEAIAEMKEMIYRAAAFRPVILGLDEVAEKPKRKNVKISSDPQTSAARQRRERISERIRVLQRIVPGGNKMDTATMLDEAANYLRFLRSQVKALEKTTPTCSFGFSSYNFLP